MNKLIVIVLVLCMGLWAGDFSGSYNTGLLIGSGTFNDAKWTEGDTSQVNYDYPNMRWANQLRLNGRFSNFSFRLNGLHTTGFAEEETISQPKMYEAWLGYHFKAGQLNVGRISSFNRWYWGSYDGARFNMKLSPVYRLQIYGGLLAPYGEWFDTENSIAMVYGQLDYVKKNFGVKAKTQFLDENLKTGMDLWARFNNFKIAADIGYDFTDERVSDAGINGFYNVSESFVLSGNYRLMRSLPWQFSFSKFSVLSERLTFGMQYNLNSKWYVALKQIAGLTTDYQSYITHLIVGNEHIYAGFNYTTSNYDISRIGFSLGGKYQLIRDLWLSGAVSPVNYQYYGFQDKIFTLSSYLRLQYKLLDNLAIGTYWGLYNDLGSADSIPERYKEMKIRGQVFMKVNF